MLKPAFARFTPTSKAVLEKTASFPSEDPQNTQTVKFSAISLYSTDTIVGQEEFYFNRSVAYLLIRAYGPTEDLEADI